MVAQCLDDAGAWWRTPDKRIQSKKGDAVPWQVVANADLVVLGTMRLSGVETAELTQRRGNVLSIVIGVSEVLKGSIPDRQVTLLYYTGPEYTGPGASELQRASGTDSILFLEEEAGVSGSYYFADHRIGALLDDVTSAEVQSVRMQISQIDMLAERTAVQLPTYEAPLDSEVAALLDRATEQGSAQTAVCQLLALGRDAAPALIRRMDDRRKIALTHVSLRAPPDYFESVLHYGPEEVVDLISIVLSYSVGESFGFINNGGSEQERRRVIKGWRVWLGKELGL